MRGSFAKSSHATMDFDNEICALLETTFFGLTVYFVRALGVVDVVCVCVCVRVSLI